MTQKRKHPGVLAMLLGIWLKAEDRKKKYGLELPNIKK